VWLQDLEAVVTALEDHFCDTSEEPNELQVKAEQAYRILAMWKMVY
jgi:hypothetical protein